MNIVQHIREARGLTPTEQQLGATVLAMGERLQSCSIKELAHAANASVPSVHRFCKKLGLEGFKELKIELARALARGAADAGPVDINFPFEAGDRGRTISQRMESVYESTLRDTRNLLDFEALDHAAELIDRAESVGIYTQSHNLYPAQMFCDRLLSAGKQATCFESFERNIRLALASGPQDAAILISYSGLSTNLVKLAPTLLEHKTPCIYIGTPHGCRLNPGMEVYLQVSDRESLQNRITQFASHIAVQYVLDTLYGCFFARDYERCSDFLQQSLPYTRIQPRQSSGPVMSHEEYVAQMLREIK